ncbi:MAG: C25 family cysteine peptidase [bacterium]
MLIVGDANEGGEPEKNQVQVYYFEDATGACYFGNSTVCPTEDEIVDFNLDTLGDMQVARLPLTHRWKVARAVENFVNKVANSEASDRALLTVGDYEWQGSTPDGLPELMAQVIAAFDANGYETRYMRETDYGRYDYLVKQLATADSLNEGVDILFNIGTVSNRHRIAGDFIQKAESPVWNMEWLDDSGPRPFVFFGPSCDIADFDRNNSYDPILAEMFLTNEPQKPAAVAWISHGRGNWATWYRVFAAEFVDWLFSGDVVDVLDCYWKTKWDCWVKYPEMREFLRSLFYLGWPVSIRGTCSADVGAETLSAGALRVVVSPNPSSSGGVVRFGLPMREKVKLEVFDVRGRSVVVLVDGEYDGGWHIARWNGLDSRGARVAPAVYFARLTTERKSVTAKMLVLQ